MPRLRTRTLTHTHTLNSDGDPRRPPLSFLLFLFGRFVFFSSSNFHFLLIIHLCVLCFHNSFWFCSFFFASSFFVVILSDVVKDADQNGVLCQRDNYNFQFSSHQCDKFNIIIVMGFIIYSAKWANKRRNRIPFSVWIRLLRLRKMT